MKQIAVKGVALAGRAHRLLAVIPPLFYAIEFLTCFFVFVLRGFAGNCRRAAPDAPRPRPARPVDRDARVNTIGEIEHPALKALVNTRLGEVKGTALDPLVPPGTLNPFTTLRLYEYEGCPFCRLAREAISALDLDCEMRPAPRETLKTYGIVTAASRFRPHAVAVAGEPAAFPILVDGDRVIRDSNEIVRHLYATYGGKGKDGAPIATPVRPSGPATIPFFASTLMRSLPEHGVLVTPSRWPNDDGARPQLELWGRETSVSTKLVRECLTSLQLPYLLRSAPIGTTRAAEMAARAAEIGVGRGRLARAVQWLRGAVGLPPRGFLHDPSTGFASACPREAVAYLRDTYQTGPVSSETIADYSVAGATAQHGTLDDLGKKSK